MIHTYTLIADIHLTGRIAYIIPTATRSPAKLRHQMACRTYLRHCNIMIKKVTGIPLRFVQFLRVSSRYCVVMFLTTMEYIYQAKAGGLLRRRGRRGALAATAPTHRERTLTKHALRSGLRQLAATFLA